MNKRNINKTIKILVLFFSAFFLHGCLNFTQVTTIKKDKTGSMFIHWQYNWISGKDSLEAERMYFFHKDSIKSLFSSKHITIESIEVYKDLNDSTIHGKIEFDFDNFDSLKTAEAFSYGDFGITENDDGTETFSQHVQPFISSFGAASKNKIIYVFYLPGKILKHNADKISRNKLTWEFSGEKLSKSLLMKAVYKPFNLKETPRIIYYLTVFVLLIVIIFLFYKRK
ncbi:MAG: hypothetical protein GXO87_06220 [Chlorobi bacterium]|nr:hypothetical protein [Chlorobiota bacterium]